MGDDGTEWSSTMACGWHHSCGPYWGWERYAAPPPPPWAPAPSRREEDIAELGEYLRRLEREIARVRDLIEEVSDER